MTLVSIPANPVPEDVVSGTIKTPDGAELRFARWAPPAGRKGTVCVFTGAARDRKIFRDRARPARSRLCGGDDRLARAGPFVAAAARSAQGPCARFRRLRDRCRDLRAAGGAAGLPAAVLRAGAFDGRRGAAAGRAFRKALVRSHGAVGADDRPAGTAHLVRPAGASEDDAAGRPGRSLRSRRQRRTGRAVVLHQQSPDQRSGALLRAIRRSSRRIRRSAWARRPSPGPIPPLPRCAPSAARIIRRKSASRS